VRWTTETTFRAAPVDHTVSADFLSTTLPDLPVMPPPAAPHLAGGVDERPRPEGDRTSVVSFVVSVLVLSIIVVGGIGLVAARLDRGDEGGRSGERLQAEGSPPADAAGSGGHTATTGTTASPAQRDPTIVDRWIVVVASLERSEGHTEADAEDVASRTPGAKVLDTDLYSDLAPEIWAVYLGPFDSEVEAGAACRARGLTVDASCLVRRPR
jgi:hypothetical protein